MSFKQKPDGYWDSQIYAIFESLRGYASTEPVKRTARSRSAFINSHFKKQFGDDLTEKEKRNLTFLLTCKFVLGRCCIEHDTYDKEIEHERRRIHHLSAAKKMRREIKEGNALCEECGIKNNLTIDHIVPVALGGRTEDGNLRILCSFCNEKKADNLIADFQNRAVNGKV